MFFRFLSFACLLTFAVNSINPHFAPFLPGISYGEYNEIQEKVTLKVFPGSLEASLLSYKEPYDSLVLVGDVMLARNVEYLTKKNNCDYPFSNFDLSKISANPAVIGNFEGVIPKEHVTTPEFGLRFSVPEDCITSLSGFGFTNFSLANNHSNDFGKTGLNNTYSILNSSSLDVFGLPNELNHNSISFIDTVSGRVSIIGIHALSGSISDSDLLNVLNIAEQNSVKQIVYIHWGDEYVKVHNTAQEKLAERLVGYGADLIIGHHPHVVQDVDIIEGVPVFYSLGNYVFDQYFSQEVQQGLVLHIDFDKETRIHLLPVSSENTLSSPKEMSMKSKDKFLGNLSIISHTSLKEQIKSGTILWYSEVATSPKVAIMTK